MPAVPSTPHAACLAPWRAEFADPALEAAFRHRHLHAARRFCDIALAFCLLASLALAVADLLTMPLAHPAVHALLAHRAAMVATAACGLWAVRRWPHVAADGLLPPLLMVLTLQMLGLVTVLKQGEAAFITAAVGLVCVAAALLPGMRLRVLAPTMAWGLTFYLACFALTSAAETGRIVANAAMLGVTGALALGTLHRLSFAQRRQYALLQQAREVNAALQQQIVEREALQLELQRLSSTDPLTGLANRRGLQQQWTQARARADRSGRPLALCVLDLDHFKHINDRHGHSAGDEVLQGVAALLREQLRDGDLAARLGGEEFALLMPDTDLPEAAAAMERLRLRIAAQPFAAGELGALRVTVTAGVAAWREADGDWNGLLARADAALYEGKRRGRDRTVSAEAGPALRLPEQPQPTLH